MRHLYETSNPWTTAVQWVYLRQSYEQYRARHGDPVIPNCWHWDSKLHRSIRNKLPQHIKDLPYLAELYRIGHEGGQIKISYQEFEDRVLSGALGPCNRHHVGSYYVSCPRDDYEHWYPRRGAHYRHRVPQGIPGPHGIDEKEQSRRDWREHKGFQRSRNQDQNWRRGLGARQYCRVAGNRAMRRWEKTQITKQDFEALADQGSILKLWMDPWDWD